MGLSMGLSMGLPVVYLSKLGLSMLDIDEMLIYTRMKF